MLDYAGQAVAARQAVKRLASQIHLDTWRLNAVLWVRRFVMGVDPSNARCTGQINSIQLSDPRGSLQQGSIFKAD